MKRYIIFILTVLGIFVNIQPRITGAEISTQVKLEESKVSAEILLRHRFNPATNFAMGVQLPEGLFAPGGDTPRNLKDFPQMLLAFQSPYVSFGKLPTQGVLGDLLAPHGALEITAQERFTAQQLGKPFAVVASVPFEISGPADEVEPVYTLPYAGRFGAGWEISTKGERYLALFNGHYGGLMWGGLFFYALPYDRVAAQSGGTLMMGYVTPTQKLVARQLISRSTAIKGLGILTRGDYQYTGNQAKVQLSALFSNGFAVLPDGTMPPKQLEVSCDIDVANHAAYEITCTIFGPAIMQSRMWELKATSLYTIPLGEESAGDLQATGNTEESAGGVGEKDKGAHSVEGGYSYYFKQRGPWYKEGYYQVIAGYQWQGVSFQARAKLQYRRYFLEYRNELMLTGSFSLQHDPWKVGLQIKAPILDEEQQGEPLAGALLSGSVQYQSSSISFKLSISSKLHGSLEFSYLF